MSTTSTDQILAKIADVDALYARQILQYKSEMLKAVAKAKSESWELHKLDYNQTFVEEFKVLRGQLKMLHSLLVEKARIALNNAMTEIISNRETGD